MSPGTYSTHCIALVGRLSRIGRHDTNAVKRDVELVGTDHGHRGSKILTQLHLAGEQRDRAIAYPGIEAGRLDERARQRSPFRTSQVAGGPQLKGRQGPGVTCRPAHSTQHPVIGATTAEVAAELRAHLGVGGLRVPVEQGFGRDDHPGYAEAALDHILINESLLHRVKVLGSSEPFERRDLTPTDVLNRELARVNCPPINQHLACPH